MKKIKSNAPENIKIAFLLNLCFSILEIVGGILTNSISILSDAIHDFGDSISIGVSYILEKKSQKQANNDYTYGYLRYSILGALITSLVLLIGSGFVIYQTIPRLLKPEVVNHDAMIIFAIFGVAINGFAAYKTSKGEKHNEKFINLHMMEDTLGWLAVLIGSILIKIFGWNIVDALLSLFIAIYILYHVYKYMKDIFNIFMEKTPNNVKIDEIKKNVEVLDPSIKNLHHIHIWTIDGTNNYMTVHVLLNKDLNTMELINLKSLIRKKLEEYNISHVTIEFDYYNENCTDKKC